MSAEVTTLALASITRAEALCMRAAGINRDVVSDYAELYKAGAVLPPVVVFRDAQGAQLLADGFHRCAGAELAGLAELPAEVRVGSRKDALLYAASANAAHGLRRSNADKRRAVLLVLAGWPRWSDRRVAEACGVDHKTVAAARAVAGGEIPQGEPASSGAPDLDRLVSRLSKALARVLKAGPAERRAELRKLLDVVESGVEERLR